MKKIISNLFVSFIIAAGIPFVSFAAGVPSASISSEPSARDGLVKLDVGDTITFTKENNPSSFIANAFAWSWDKSILKCNGYPDFDSPDFRCKAIKKGTTNVSLTLFGVQEGDGIPAQISNVIKVVIEENAVTITCGGLSISQKEYFDQCSREGYNNVCFSRSGEYQGCGMASRNDCTEHNENAATNVMCRVPNLEKVSCCVRPTGGGVQCEEWPRWECEQKGGKEYDSCQQCWDSFEESKKHNWKLWGPGGETFFLLPIGESIRLKSNATVKDNVVFEGAKKDQIRCQESYSGNEAQWECTAIATGRSNSEVFFYPRSNPSNRSNTVVIQVEGGDVNSVVPPAGYEDDVRVNYLPAENPFSDMDISTLEGIAAAELYRRGIIGGFSDGEFKGDRPVNRAEAAKFLLLARYGDVSDVANNSRFPDVLDEQWYTKYVVRAADLGIISGHPSGLFKPADPVLTSEFLKMFALTFGPEKSLSSYVDVPEDSWFAWYAGIAQQYQLFPDRTTQLFPDRPLTRGEVAVAIYQYLKNRGEVFDIAPVVPSVPEPIEYGSTSPSVDDDPRGGSSDAPVTMIEFTDYQCPFCARYALQTLPLIAKEYVETGKVRYVVRDYPLSFHQNSQKAAEATECADDQNYFGQMHDMLFSRQGEWSGLADASDVFVKYAGEIGVSNLNQFRSCLENGTYASETQLDMADGQASGIRGTPGFWIIGTGWKGRDDQRRAAV